MALDVFERHVIFDRITMMLDLTGRDPVRYAYWSRHLVRFKVQAFHHHVQIAQVQARADQPQWY